MLLVIVRLVCVSCVVLCGFVVKFVEVLESESCEDKEEWIVLCWIENSSDDNSIKDNKL